MVTRGINQPSKTPNPSAVGVLSIFRANTMWERNGIHHGEDLGVGQAGRLIEDLKGATAGGRSR